MSGPKPISMEGKRFGKLVVLGIDESKSFGSGVHRHWICQCDCGERSSVAGHLLRKGRVKSCGCYRDELLKVKFREMVILRNAKLRKEVQSNPDPLIRFHTALHPILKNYRVTSKKKGLVLELTDRDIYDLIIQRCFYCGVEPTNLIDIPYHQFKYNGIDRVDNNKGYTKDNCVPCCIDCNRSKRKMTLEAWKSYIKRLLGSEFVKREVL